MVSSISQSTFGEDELHREGFQCGFQHEFHNIQRYKNIYLISQGSLSFLHCQKFECYYYSGLNYRFSFWRTQAFDSVSVSESCMLLSEGHGSFSTAQDCCQSVKPLAM